VRTTGIAESAIAEILGSDFLSRLGGDFSRLTLAYLPGIAGVDLRVTARGLPKARAEELVRQTVLKLRELVSAYVYGEGEEDLASVVIARCRELGRKLAVAESCTGGMVGERITSIPGSSDIFVGGIIAYDNAVKQNMLGVSADSLARYGAVSEQVALEMAAGVKQKLKADIGISVTGIAGPGGGTPEKPVGLVWIVVDTTEPKARRLNVIGDRTEIRQRAVQAALEMVRRALATG